MFRRSKITSGELAPMPDRYIDEQELRLSEVLGIAALLVVDPVTEVVGSINNMLSRSGNIPGPSRHLKIASSPEDME